MTNALMERLRMFLKDNVRQEFDFSATDQNRGVPPPPVEKPYLSDDKRLPLPAAGDWKGIKPVQVPDAIGCRRSRRQFTDGPLTLDELAFLLWATQGVREVRGPGMAFRTVPSAGARHALETYICVLRVSGLDPALYRYLPLEHELLLVDKVPDLGGRLTAATLGQAFVGRAAVVFAWTAVPYRMEWRYGPASHKVIALDAGHVCQNLYLACSAIDAGTCAIAAYNQQGMDRLLGVDGREEFTIYLAPVGKV